MTQEYKALYHVQILKLNKIVLQSGHFLALASWPSVVTFDRTD